MQDEREVRVAGELVSRVLSVGFLAVLLFGFAASVRGSDVSFYLVAGKGQGLTQTNGGAPVLQTGTPFQFLSFADETASGAVSSASVTIPGGTTNALTQCCDDPPQAKFNAQFTTSNAMNSAYASGSYTQTIVTVHDGTKVAGLTLTGDVYPNDPHVSNWTAAQSVNVDIDFVVTWDAFTGGTASDFVQFEVDDNMDNPVFETVPEPGAPGSFNGTNTSIVIPAGTLAPGTNYNGYLLFAKFAASNTTAYAGVRGVAGCFKKTQFNISTLPLPSNVVFFDDFQQFSSGTVLNPTNYTPPVGLSAQFNSGSGGAQVTASNFLGSIRAFFNNPIGSSGGEYLATPSGGPPTNQVLDITWTLWIELVKTPFSTNQFGVQIPTTNEFGMFPDDTQSLILFFDSGTVGVVTNLSPPRFVTIGSWSNFVGTVMTNELILNYPAHSFSFSINGTTLSNMPLWVGFTNIFTDISFGPGEKSSGAQGNRFARRITSRSAWFPKTFRSPRFSWSAKPTPSSTSPRC